jgi:predicted P-loop ATPase/GTPase
LDYEFRRREKGSTRHKLEEARFFFDEMKRNLEDDKIFSFYLSAFITAARSIIDNFMQKEFKNITGFTEWYQSKQEIIQSDDFKFFNQMRVATVHTNRIKPNKEVYMGITESPISVTDSVDVKVVRAGYLVEEHSSQDTKKTDTLSEPLEKNVSASSKAVKRHFKEYPEKKLDELCQRYLQDLTKLVDECEQQFNNL